MRKALIDIVVGFICVATQPGAANAQTYLLPDTANRDPRMAIIRQKLQTDHGSIRPLTTYVDMDINRSWDEQGFFFSTLQTMLLEAGAEPVNSRQGAQFLLYLGSHGSIDQNSDAIVETLTLRLTDLRASGGGQLIMSSTATLQCQDTRRRAYLSMVCPISREMLVETFLRLR